MHSPELSLLRDPVHVRCSHLSKEALPASLGNKQPLPQQSHELLLGELPALHLVGAFPIHTTEKVCLSGFCYQEEMTLIQKLTDMFSGHFCVGDRVIAGAATLTHQKKKKPQTTTTTESSKER